MMKRLVKIISFALVLSMLSGLGSVSYAEEDTTEKAITLINNMRSELGIPKIEANLELKNAALTHCKYMDYYNSFSVIEESENQLSRGRYSWDRAAFFKYEEQYITELIAMDSAGFATEVNSMLENPYARISLIDPKYQSIGMNYYENYSSFVIGGAGRSQTQSITYPYDNQINVPITWTNEYRFSPYESLGISEDLYGIPITYSYYAKEDDVENIIINSSSIVYGADQTSVEFKVLSPTDDKYLTNSIIIVPTEAYRYDTTYKVTLDLTIEFDERIDLNVTKTFSFQTERNPNRNNLLLSNDSTLLTRVVFTEEIVKALGYPLLDASKMTFTDVDINSVRAKYIYTAFYNNIIFGQSDELFAPDLNITRQEAYTILVRAFEAKIGRSIQYFEESPINDYMNLSPWAMDNKCILKAAGVGFLVTNSYNNLIPQGHVSEKEFVLIVEKFREALNRY
ncbi:MAG: S-layer homology domain-containing protein [Vallitaleaceae bacterium]|nr:S-layer homology domain-containing protein [Vallitaleaceae bacterium]